MSFNPKLFQEKYRINTCRANWHDYYGGAYFVTVVTKNRCHYFGEIDEFRGKNVMHLNRLGKFMNESIMKIPEHQWYAYSPIWTVMPNHIHMILLIDKRGSINNEYSTINDFSRRGVRSHASTTNDEFIHHIPNNRSRNNPPISPKKGSLGLVVGQLKRCVTRFANKNNIPFAWQSLYWDNIIFNQNEFDNISNYIQNNIEKWQKDHFNQCPIQNS